MSEIVKYHGLPTLKQNYAHAHTHIEYSIGVRAICSCYCKSRLNMAAYGHSIGLQLIDVHENVCI